MVADDPRRRRLALTAVLLVLVAWSGSVVRGGFAFDDAQAIEANPAVAGDLPLAEVFRRDYWHHRDDAGHYRPVATLSLRLDHALYGERAWGYHLTNVLLQALVVALLAWTLARTTGAGPFVVLGLAVFAAHPALADAVAWISGRTSMLGALGGTMALASVVGVRRLPLVPVGTTLGLLLGLLSKEDTVVFALPVLLLAWRRSRPALVATGLSVLFAVGVYLLLRAGALGAALPSAPHAPLAEAGLGPRLVYAGRGLLEGARLRLWPVSYPPNYRLAAGFHPGEAAGAWALLGWLPWLALLGGGLWLARGREATRRLVGISMAMAALCLLPVLQLVPAGVVFAPRFLYLPLLFGVPALGWVLRRLPSVLVGVLLAAFVVGAWVRAGVYADPAAYNREILKHVPRDAAAWNGLGLALEAQGDVAGARQAWGTATRLDPGHSRTWTNLGWLAMQEDDEAAAERFFERAVQAGPRNAVARCNLASLYLRQERFAQAADRYEEAFRLAPGLLEAARGLGHARYRMGDLDGAEAALAHAARLSPADAATRALREAVARARAGR